MNTPTYGEHITLAARYAALALTAAPPQPAEVPGLLVLRDDLVVNLAGLVRELSCPTRVYRRHGSVAVLAKDPVAALTARLGLLPHLGDLDRPPPSHRFAGRPASPTQSVTTTGAWKGLAIETMLALDCLDRGRTPLSDPARWTALGDVAVLAEAIDPLDQTLLPARARPRLSIGLSHLREADAALAVEAREVQALARGPRDDDAAAVVPAGRQKVAPVASLESLPAAVTALTDLLVAIGPDLSATGALAAAIALAKTSLLSAGALRAALCHPGAPLPALLADTADALHRHAHELQPEIVRMATRLATLHEGTPGIRCQATEIGGEGARRIQDVLSRPHLALAASPALLECAARLVHATDALASAVEQAHQGGRLLVRDPSNHPRRNWGRSCDLQRSAPLAPQLRAAATAVAAAPPSPQPWSPPAPSPPAGAIDDLAATLSRRHTASRPPRPGLPRLTTPAIRS